MQLIIGEVPQLDPRSSHSSHASARNLVGFAERHALPHQPLSDVGGKRMSGRRCRTMRSVSNVSVSIIPADRRQQQAQGVDTVEHRLLVFLQVAVVGEGQPFKHRSTAVRLPIKRPDLPRASSAMSGFRFCGMIEDPVAKASSSFAQPNSCDVHSTTSSPRRERWMPIIAVANKNSATKSRSLTASIEFAHGSIEAELAAVACGSSGSDEPASAPAPSGEYAVRRSQSRSRLDVTAQAHEHASSNSWAKDTGCAC